MNVVSVVETVIKDHPLIDFDHKTSSRSMHWCLCPCGFSTKKYRSQGSAQKAFKAHIVEEVNEALVEQQLLVLRQGGADKALPSVPAKESLSYA